MVTAVTRYCLGLVFAAFATGAAAADYVVVRSSDARFVRGQAFDAGARVALANGATMTLMHASGDIVTVRGSQGVVSLPKRAASAPDADRMAVLKFILDRPPSEPGAKRLRTRGAICPPVETISTLDAIAQVYQSGCADQAAEALDVFLAAGAGAPP